MHTPEMSTHYIERSADKQRIQSDLSAMTEIFGRELTPDLAKTYIQSLANHIGRAHESYDAFVKQGKEVHRTLGRDLYGPLIIGFLQWTEGKLAEYNIKNGPVHFALRDAWPFYAAAHVLWDGSNVYHPVGTYLNRPLLSVEDEIAPEHASANGFVSEYLKKSGITDEGKPVALVDSGAWGSVVRAIKETYLPHTPFYPLFWYAHNPHIPGFLNEILSEASIPIEFGEVLNDSMECVFPQQYRRPLSFETNGGAHTLALVKSDPLSIAWGQAALEGVMEAAHAYKGGIDREKVLNALQNAYSLSDRAKKTGEWTGVLPTHTPTWSKGEAFLAAWPKDLLP